MGTDGGDAWAVIDARFGTVRPALAGWTVTLGECADSGTVSARRQLLEVADQIRSWTGEQGSAGNLFLKMVEDSGTTGTLRDSLERHAREASEAFAEAGRFLEQELAPRGRAIEAV